MFRLKYTCPTLLPLSDQLIVIPPVLPCNGCEQCDGERMEVELL